MSEAQHTPGPWSVSRYGGWKTDVRSAKGRRIAATFVQCQPKTPEGYVKQAATNEANACLIAAAPELLSALKRMLPEANSSDLHLSPSFEVCEAARNAIAKAEGRS